MTMKETFAETLRDLMKEQSVTVRQLGRDINIDHATVSRWINGKVLPQVEYLAVLAQYFSCSTDYLLGLKDS